MARPPRKSGNGPSRRPSAYRPRVAGRGRPSAAGESQTPEDVESPETTQSPATTGTSETAPVKGATAESADSSAEGAADSEQGGADTADTVEGAKDQDSAEGTTEPVADYTEAAETSEPVAETTAAALTTEAADTTEVAEPAEGADTADASAGEGPSLEKSDAGAAETRPTAKTRRVARVSTIKPNTGASKTSATEASSDQDSKKRRGGSPTSLLKLSRRTLTVLGVITGVLVIAAIVLAFHPGATIGPNKAFVDQAATTELVSQAQTKVCTANSANGTKFDEWSNKARAGLTGEALAQFNKQVAPLKQVMEQAKATTDCQIDAIGVRELTGSGDGSRAVIVVNMVLSGTQNGVPTQSLTPRYQVNMEKQGDSWLIAKVADI